MGNVINLPNINPNAIVIPTNDSGNNGSKVKTFDEKNYLNVRLDKNEKSKTLTIRLLPMDLETGSPFVNVHMHNMAVPKEVSPNGYKSYICLSKNKDIDHEKFGDKCPFCELSQNAWKEYGHETDEIKKENFKKVANANTSREAVIVRCIERGKEDEGVKFWKFNLRYDKTDPYNTIVNLYEIRKAEGLRAGIDLNILDIYSGRDLNVTITEGNAAPTIVDAAISTPLSKDEEQMKAWIYDPKKWQDVFTCKPYEYLKLISEMKVPWYDKKAGVWVDKTEYEAEHGKIETKTEEEIKEAEKKVLETSQPQPAPQPQVQTQDFTSSLILNSNDDLPF